MKPSPCLLLCDICVISELVYAFSIRKPLVDLLVPTVVEPTNVNVS